MAAARGEGIVYRRSLGTHRNAWNLSSPRSARSRHVCPGPWVSLNLLLFVSPYSSRPRGASSQSVANIHTKLCTDSHRWWPDLYRLPSVPRCVDLITALRYDWNTDIIGLAYQTRTPARPLRASSARFQATGPLRTSA